MAKKLSPSDAALHEYTSTGEDERFLLEPLKRAGPRPVLSAPREAKKNYAERLSRALAMMMADRLRPKYRGRQHTITPTADEQEHEASVSGEGGSKRVDVAVWHRRDGLLLDLSIKTLSFQDWDEKKKRAGRYTKNMSRNDHELQAEASRIHRRQPYAVLAGLMFMPMSSCDDGERDKSSFAHAVVTFRERSGRLGPDDLRYERFERFFIALYQYEGPEAGQVRFFDVARAPPRQRRPTHQETLSLAQVADALVEDVASRNNPEPEWADDKDNNTN
ncbi:hypothetical protein MYSTI_05953 [Myxococcus stipitatus DSM 14675]|uniref:Uncharacterized protein n=1 Tax=Myxococcus stipitatus (strain DSM 14675 / JCM 12634 / Mx s8) TaxID=1278073 RepID=L7UE82_MYXSD|nr:hypothetical protein [Myxococcus stipitatus]AGC47226.1 hypothetical protein MYSTI_05953 [Myxococcus stipitatus DSM 14675]